MTKVEANEREREKQRQRFEDAMMQSLKIGEGLQAKDHRGPLQDGKGKARDSYLEASEGAQPCKMIHQVHGHCYSSNTKQFTNLSPE